MKDWPGNLEGIGSLIIFGKSNFNGSLMIHVTLPEDCAASRRLPFYLAMEEYLAREFSGEYFFMWQVEPTVIFGRNQIIDAEVNLDYCRRKGIDTCRRKSGGGCVYADMNNIMFSHITTCSSVVTTFADFTGRVAAMLRGLELDARTTGRNDIMIGDRKVSGYAFYHIPLAGGREALSRAIVHGTMLYDADLDTMTAALTPSEAKLNAKGVASVRSHVTTIKEHCNITLEDFKAYTVSRLCSGELKLTLADVAAIELIEKSYYNPRWIFGRRYGSIAVDSGNRPVRIDGVGEFVVDVALNADGLIESVDLKGDFFLTADLDTIVSPLIGAELTEAGLTSALGSVDVGKTIAGFDNGRFVRLLLEAPPE